MAICSTELTPNFVILNNKLFAKYFVIFRINDSYQINEFSLFKSKYQLLFKKIENKNQHLNLSFVDSLFVNIIADLTLEVFLKKISSFQEYILSNHKINLLKVVNKKNYFKYKFSDFIHLLLYSNISSTSPFTQKLFTDRVFCLRNKSGHLEYFSIIDQNKLHSKLLDEMKIEIDFDLSTISNHEIKLCLKIFY